eukprot:TRINITY_DN18113_c0_g1_i1.p1 TRINITY_DN18113_c0_g1~~TRINITY_DN18113_c0_g1_i1.p1  ORF type:complete len:537 (+),score=33.42 TRINITY_DN18113_c0_g1_i1:84-1613(+)
MSDSLSVEDSVHSGSRSHRELPWHRYVPKAQTMDNCYDHPFTFLRAQDRHSQKYVGIELIPRRYSVAHLFPLKSSCLLQWLQLSHASLCEICDIFYSPDLQCLCLVHNIPSQARTLRQFYEQINRLELKIEFDCKAIRSIFRQIVRGIEYLLQQGMEVSRISMDDIIVWQDKSGEFIAQIRYLKFKHVFSKTLHDEDHYSLLESPESVFPELHRTNKNTNKNSEAHEKDLQNKQICWQLGLILYQMCLGQLLPDFLDGKDEYLDEVDDLVNSMNDPNQNWKCSCLQELVSSLLELEIQERTNFEQVCKKVWIAYAPEIEQESKRTQDFISQVRIQLTHCLLDNHINDNYMKSNVHRQEGLSKLNKVQHYRSDGVAQNLHELVNLSYEDYAHEAKNIRVSDSFYMSPRSSVDLASPRGLSRRSSESLSSHMGGGSTYCIHHGLYKHNCTATPMSLSLMSIDSLMKEPLTEEPHLKIVQIQNQQSQLERPKSFGNIFQKFAQWIKHHGHEN